MNVYLHFDYALANTAAPVSAELRALIDGRPHCSGNFPFKPNPADFVYCPNPWVAAPGRHTLRWEIDGSDDIRETDEGNNVADLTFDVSGTSVCAGDCDGDGTVSIAELIVAVNMALGARPISDCPSLDADGDGQIAINELIAAVSNALNGCAV